MYRNPESWATSPPYTRKFPRPLARGLYLILSLLQETDHPCCFLDSRYSATISSAPLCPPNTHNQQDSFLGYLVTDFDPTRTRHLASTGTRQVWLFRLLRR